MASSDLTAARLRELLHYDQITGVFTWLVNRGANKMAGRTAGKLHHKGYIQISIDNKIYQAHRLAWLYMTGEWPTGEVDHEFSQRADNRWARLRDVSKSLNQQNQRTARVDNKVGLLGVRAKGGKFTAQIQTDKKWSHLGTFDTADQAHAAYLTAKRIRHASCTI